MHQLFEEANASVGTALLAVGAAALADETGFWTQDDQYASRIVMLGVRMSISAGLHAPSGLTRLMQVAGLHSVLKQMWYPKLKAYVQVVGFCAAMSLFRTGQGQHSLHLMGGTVSVCPSETLNCHDGSVHL